MNKFRLNEYVIINDRAKRDLPYEVGKLAFVSELNPSISYEYRVNHGNTKSYVKEKELNKVPQDKLDYYLKVNTWKRVKVKNTNTIYEVSRLNFLNETVEVIKDNDEIYAYAFYLLEEVKDVFVDNVKTVNPSTHEELGTGYFKEKGMKLGEIIDTKQAAYGDSVSKSSELMKIYLQDYKQEDGTYKINEKLLDHILLQVRIIDKQNRIFSNPEADLMDESPYTDISGYGLLGERMQNK